MKVWVTKPGHREVLMGGIRNVLLWIEQPYFDHSPSKFFCTLHDPKTDKLIHEVSLEGGWTSASGSIKAKPFFKQDKELRSRLMKLIWDSIEPLDSSEFPTNEQLFAYAPEYDAIVRDNDPFYESKSKVHEKRFLAEVDIRASRVVLIQPRVKWMQGATDVDEATISHERMANCLYFDEDNNRPVTEDMMKGYKRRYEILPF